MNKRKLLLGIIVLIFLLSLQVTLAFPTPRNIVGTVSGACAANANVSIWGFSIAQLDNFVFLEDSTNTTSDGAGSYAGVVTDDDPGPDAGGAAGLEIRVNVTNPGCSPSAFGTVTDTVTNIVNTIDVNISVPFSLSSPTNGSLQTDNTTSFSWSNDIVSPNYTILIDDNSDFSSPVVNTSDISSTNYTLPSELSDNTYYWKIEARQGSTFIMESGTNNFNLVSGAPVITNVNPSNTTWIGSTSTTISVTTSSNANCAYATTANVSFGSKTAFGTTGTSSHSDTFSLSSEGNNTFYFQCNGTNGILNTNDYIHYAIRDTTDPVSSGATVTVNSGSSYATTSTLNITWSNFTDASSGIAGYYINTTNNQGTTTGQSDSASPGQLTGISDGSVTVYVWAVDNVGNIGNSASDSITVDTVGPAYSSFSTSPSDLTQYVSSSYQVFATITDTSSLSGLPQLRYRIGSDAYTTAADMALVGGNVYSFTIPNQAAPNDWASRAGENLTYIINATDIHGFSTNTTRTEFIDNDSSAPTFTALSNILGTQDVQISINLSATDPDDDSLTFSSNFSGFTITSVNSTLSTATWTPTNSDVGVTIVTFSVTDGNFQVNQTITIVVQNVNDAPVLAAIGDLDAYEYVEFNYTLNATDVDNDNITFSSDSTLFAVNSLTGAILFTPVATDRGEHIINFSASDGSLTDSENVTLTVGYCGDAVCSTTYESCSLCQTDCGVCEDDDSQGFIIPSKTCLGEALEIQAKELITRGTCEVEGVIIDGLEACGNLTSTTINVEKKILGTYTQIDQLLTNDLGIASYAANETGSYRLRYDSADFDKHAVTFTIRECGFEDGDEDEQGEDESNQNTQVPPKLPDFEEPTTVDEITSSTGARLFVFFVLFPMLFVLLIIAGATTYYTYSRKQGGNGFTSQVDNFNKKIGELIKTYKEKLFATTFYAKIKPILNIIKKEIHRTEEDFLKLLEPLLIQRKLSIPHYELKVGIGREHQLILLSLMSYIFKRQSLDSLVEAIIRENKSKPINLRSFAKQASEFGLKVEYHFSTTKDKLELMELHNIIKVDKTYPTMTDIKKYVTKGLPVVVVLHMKSLNGKAPDQNFFGIIKGYNKKGFFISDYEFSRRDAQLIGFNTFKKAWEASGYSEIAVIKKKRRK